MKNRWMNSEVLSAIKGLLAKVNLENEDITPDVKAYVMNQKLASGKYRVVVVIGLHDWIGQLDRKRFGLSLPAELSSREANTAAVQIEQGIRKALELARKNQQHHDFLQSIKDFIESKRGKIRDNTVDGYEYRLKHVEHFFAGKGFAVEDISPIMIREFIEWMETKGKKGQPLGYRSIKDTHGLLYGFFQDQLGKGIIKTNPCEGTVLKKRQTSNIETKQVRWLQLQEYRQFMNWLVQYRDDNTCPFGKLYDMLMLTIYSGMRKEEIIGLRWDAVDLEGKHFVIRRTRTRGKKVYDLDDVKSPASYRTYPITMEIEELFKRLKEKAVKECGNSKYVFSWSSEDKNRWSKRKPGEPYDPDYIVSIFNKMIKQYYKDTGNDLSGLTFHKFRHSNASILFDQGWSMDQVKQWLGHEDVGVTEKVYVHKLETWKDKQAESLKILWDNNDSDNIEKQAE